MSKFFPAVPRTDFGPAPPGYVAGLGRGAVGFTTRSDIGPAAQSNVNQPETDGRIRTLPGGGPNRQGEAQTQPEGKEEDLSESRFDQFGGYTENLFANATYDEDDKEADATYASIDQRMDSRRKRRREELLKLEMLKYRKTRPRIQEQFADIKRTLGEIGAQEWESIPEPLDFSRHNKIIKQQQAEMKTKYTPVPDSLIDSMRPDKQNPNTVIAGGDTPLSGISTPADQTMIGRARVQVLSLNLDRSADSVSGQTVVDPKGYLTDLNSIKVNSEAEVSDIKKARLLLKSVITTNPKHAPGWIAAARLENETGKLMTARQLIQKGCEMCPTNEDVWLESATMNTPKNAKAILAKAVKHIPTSIKLWMAACTLEEDVDAKKAVLRRALEIIPNSVQLWKSAIEMENPDDARILLSRAVELVPQSVEMWLALAKLETYEKARIVLNNARYKNPTEPTIWITAAKLEEANGNAQNVDAIIQKAIQSLSKSSVTLDRDHWIQEAETCEKSGSPLTCNAIINNTIGMNVDEQDRRNTWLNDAEHLIAKHSFGTARAVYRHMLTIYKTKESIWEKAAQLERQYGTKESLDSLLAESVKACPKAEDLWLMAAKEKWLSGGVEEARNILNTAFKENPESEKIWLAAVKLESENKEYTRARVLLQNARAGASTAHVWMKSAKLERMLGNNEAQLQLLEAALQKFPTYPKLWMMLGQYYEALNQLDQAREIYKKGVKQTPNSVDLWLCYSNLEANNKEYGRARSILETARLKNSKTPKLWLSSIRVEQQVGNTEVANALMAKALQECPDSGILWAHAILSETRPKRKARSYDALKKCNDDPYVFAAAARLFWQDRKISKARNWFNSAVTVNPDIGDIWAYYYKFELEQPDGKPDEICKRVLQHNPAHGDLWCSISKQDKYASLKADEILKLLAAQIHEIFPNT